MQIINEITQFLLRFMGTPDERDMWLSQAFFFTDPRLYYQIDQIDRTGTPRVFVDKFLKLLWVTDCTADKTHQISRLLETVKVDCDADEQAQVNVWIPQLNGLCLESPPMPPLVPAPVAAPPVPPKEPMQSAATPSVERTPTVFVSYSRKDEGIAKRLIDDLIAAGHACWFDQTSISSDENWPKAISAGINNSYAFVALVSKAANASRWVQREYLAAEPRPHLSVCVLQLEDCEIPFEMLGWQVTRLFPSYEDGLKKLLAALPPPRIPQLEAAPIAVTRRNVGQRQLEMEYLSGLKLENWLKTIQSVEQYTALSGKAEVNRARDSGVRMKYRCLRAVMGEEALAEGVQEQREYTDILQAIQEIKRAALLGEPGAGKTITLWRLAKDLFDRAMADPKAPLPILVRLGKWIEADQSLTDFIRHELGELGEYLDKLIAGKRAVLLLDGLNEIPLAQRKAGKDAQVKTFVEAAHKANPELIGVISCRERDYTLDTLDLGFDRIAIMPLDPLRIREFVTRYLDVVTSEAMFWRLAGDRARTTADEFKEAFADILPAWESVFWLDDSLPEGMKWGYSWDENWHWNNWLRERANPSSLLTLAQNPYMLMMMTDIYREKDTLPDNRGELFTQFVDELIERECRTNERMTAWEADLMAGLAKLAYAMQSRRGARADDEENASTALPLAEVQPALLDEELLYLGASASILTVGDTVRFSHQLLQEYFAALYMLLEIKAKRLRATDLWKPANWWEPTGWEEAAILLVGMFPEQVNWVAEANPEVVSQCIARSGAIIPQIRLDNYRVLWLPRLTDLKGDPDPRARAAAGRALGLADLDNRPGVGLRADGLPDITWCEVPAGEFIYQNGEKLELPAFAISKYPITYKQYQAFIDAPDGFQNVTWWQGLHANGLKQQQGGPRDQAFKFWNHPRERVSWYDAIAFCRWLSATLGFEVTLPTEPQWEKAARGTDGRNYPWGNDYREGIANVNEMHGEKGKYYFSQTTAVGIYPQGASPYGVLDMSGNVLEWCLDEHDSGETNIVLSEQRALRGGMWLVGSDVARAACGCYSHPAIRSDSIGFRVVLLGVRPPSLSPH